MDDVGLWARKRQKQMETRDDNGSDDAHHYRDYNTLRHHVAQHNERVYKPPIFRSHHAFLIYTAGLIVSGGF
ncbi:hypothetical protein BDV95DRAFT_577645 [Massariosphaeria phaeospora]|uniref:Uncharacterized protein n=1 Tax=Massariosphaeria phaeospora TaxID=100035 RepID=A0A7C8IAY1_9PLEO|nr:hypothetical protein BDV95DRAFT_577645 [Massariosphaeria phaeospora]